MADQSKKSTKVQESRETALLLFAGFCVAAWLKVDAQLYFGFGAMVVGKTGVFMWGKSKEYSANTAVEVAKTKTTQVVP